MAAFLGVAKRSGQRGRPPAKPAVRMPATLRALTYHQRMPHDDGAEHNNKNTNNKAHFGTSRSPAPSPTARTLYASDPNYEAPYLLRTRLHHLTSLCGPPSPSADPLQPRWVAATATTRGKRQGANRKAGGRSKRNVKCVLACPFDMCGNLRFESMAQYRRHLKNCHLARALHPCAACTQTFHSSRALDMHQRLAHPMRCERKRRNQTLSQRLDHLSEPSSMERAEGHGCPWPFGACAGHGTAHASSLCGLVPSSHVETWSDCSPGPPSLPPLPPLRSDFLRVS